MQLDPHDLELLTDELLVHISDDEAPIDPESLAEIKRQVAQVKSGDVAAVDAFEMVDRLLKRKNA